MVKAVSELQRKEREHFSWSIFASFLPIMFCNLSHMQVFLGGSLFYFLYMSEMDQIDQSVSQYINQSITTNLIKFSQEERIRIVRQVFYLDVRQAMSHHHHKLPDRLQTFLPHEENLLGVLVEEGMSEHVLVVVILREGRGQQEGYLGGTHGVSEETGEEHAEPVDDKLAGCYTVDVQRYDVLSQHPLGIFDIDKDVRNSSWIHKTKERKKMS